MHCQFECFGIFRRNDFIAAGLRYRRPVGAIELRVEVVPGDFLENLIEYARALLVVESGSLG